MTIPNLGDLNLREWAASAQPGDRVIYFTGITGARTSELKRASQLAASGIIRIFQTRRAKGDPLFHHIAVRTSAKAPATDEPTDAPTPSRFRKFATRASPELVEERVTRTAALLAEGCTQEAIAQRLGVTRGAIANYLAKAREKGLIQ